MAINVAELYVEARNSIYEDWTRIKTVTDTSGSGVSETLTDTHRSIRCTYRGINNGALSVGCIAIVK